jgi:flagellin
MALTVNTNVASLTSQRNLSGSQDALSTSLERLSTGLRINSAKDDAAGLAISERFTAQIRGLDQGVRNANDGISLAQTAEGALGEVTNNLQRIRELAVQAANATNTAADRAALQNEVSALVAEIDRVATQTAFNGTKLLNGGFAGAVFQIGANAGDSITIDSIANSTASNLGSEVTFQVTGGTITNITLLSALADGELNFWLSGASSGPTSASPATLGALDAASTYQERAGQIVEAINNKAGTTGVFAYIDDNNAIVVQSQETAENLYVSGTAITAGMAGLGAGSAGLNDTGTTTTGVSQLSVTTYGASQTAIALVDGALNTINTTRATLGAVQSRFESAVASQQTTAENLSASRSRIQDADFASETANLAKAQILQQSGIAMLAQANAIPQNVLALLQ